VLPRIWANVEPNIIIVGTDTDTTTVFFYSSFIGHRDAVLPLDTHASTGIEGGSLHMSSQADGSPVRTFVGAPQKRSPKPVCPVLIRLLQQTLAMKQS